MTFQHRDTIDHDNCRTTLSVELFHNLQRNTSSAIIEDDYDYDFQFEGLAMLPMASSDANGMVIIWENLDSPYFQVFKQDL
jgi:hypothetical protein